MGSVSFLQLFQMAVDCMAYTCEYYCCVVVGSLRPRFFSDVYITFTKSDPMRLCWESAHMLVALCVRQPGSQHRSRPSFTSARIPHRNPFRLGKFGALVTRLADGLLKQSATPAGCHEAMEVDGLESAGVWSALASVPEMPRCRAIVSHVATA